METIKIPFSGINRSIDDGISNDGQCMELINARVKNGSIESIGKPVLISELSDVIIGDAVFKMKKIAYHAIAHKYIAIYECEVPEEDVNAYILCSLNEDFSNRENIYLGRGNASYATANFEFMGNILCLFIDRRAEYLLFVGESYRYLGNIPELPQIYVKQEGAAKENPTGDNKYHANISNLVSTFTESVWYNEVGYYDSCIDALSREGYLFGACLVRYALRTNNGTHIGISQPILVENPDSILFNNSNEDSFELSQLSDLHRSSIGDGKWKFYAFGTKYTFTLGTTEKLDGWRGLITGIDVFIAPLQWTKREELKFYHHKYFSYRNISYTDIEKDILDAYIFYKVEEWDIEGNQVWRLDDWSKDNIALQERLDVSNDFVHNLAPSITYVYNQRLHLANFKQTFFRGYNINWESMATTNTKSTVLKTFTFLDTEYGNVIVEGYINAMSIYLNPFMTYPDARAYKIIIRNESGKERTFRLKKHNYLDMACCLTDGQRVLYKEVNNSAFIEREITECYFEKTYVDSDSFSNIAANYSPQNTEIYRPNILKVSALNNPISFPASQTYQPSAGEIIGICSNSAALSQGQFGQHPLYVFSSDGVYAMSVGTNGIVYSAQTPVTRDVCTNSKSIKGIDQAVVFASKRGLMTISGTSVALLSGDMDGYLPSSVVSSPIIAKIANIGSFTLSSVDFNQYLEDAEVGYNYQENELIIANPNYPYAYLFNMGSSTWSKLSCCIKNFTNKYPECWAIIDNGVYDLQNNHRSISKILLLSKPIKMGSNSHKRILQTALRGIVKRALSDLYLRGEPVMFRGDALDIFSDVGFYILGSNDAEHFTLISGKESIVDIRDLVTKMNKSKPYKYFMVALVGGVRTDVSLNYMEFMASEAFANRLR